MTNSNDSGRDSAAREALRKALAPKERTAIPRQTMPTLDADYRRGCNEEVNQGFSAEQARLEATRCLDCPEPGCVGGCPVGIDIPGFIKAVQVDDIKGAYATLRSTSALPAVCGRVCPQERQCESKCIYNKMKKEPVAIGNLERYAADSARRDHIGENVPQTPRNGRKVAVIGSGPSGLSFAGDMAARGYDVDVYEALHEVGGVLKYGIPEFRLPNSVVDYELQGLCRAGVHFHTDTVVGKTLSYDDLLNMGYSGVFVGSGAGLPRFMGIPGENLIGVMSSNEYLTRINLMGAGRPGSDTPVLQGSSVAVIGGGNTAMDSARTAVRMGAERVAIVYRRSEEEMPARLEEVRHAREEGVEFMTLCNPVEYIGNEQGRVRAARLQRMALGEPDDSGRRSPVPIEGAIDTVDFDQVIVSVGVSPNPLVPDSIDGLATGRRGTLEVDENLRTSLPLLFAGGDIVRGGATVILAMGDGRKAAAAMAAQIEENR